MALVCGMALTCVTANAQPPVPQNNDFGGPGWNRQLTPQQMEQARKIFDNNYQAMSETRELLNAKRAQLKAVMAQPNPDKSQIETLSREIGELRGKILAARVDVRNQLSSQGLPKDFFGPNAPRRGEWDNGPEKMPGPGWRHHRGWHNGWPGGGYWGCPGMGMMRGYW